MQNLKVSLVQTEQYWEDKSKNLQHLTELLAEVETTDLIILPEMFNTGFSMNVDKLSENIEGESIQWLKALSKQKNAAVMASLIIVAQDKFYNRLVFIYPDNEEIAYYDKRQRFTLAKEDQYFSAGTSKTILSYKGWKINLQVCYDLRFPEIARNSVQEGTFDYDLLIYVANWPAKRSHHWKQLLIARAIENQCYTIGVNRVGTDDNELAYSGDSVLINPNGEADFLKPNKEEVRTFEITKDELSTLRQTLPFLKDRTI